MIKIDKEFQSLIPPLAPEEYKQLEENCIRDGIRDPLVVWPQENGVNILVDGHNRWKICADHGGIPFKTVSLNFEDRDAVKAWILKNQLGRRNLNTYNRSLLALELKPLIAERAKENQIASGGAVPQKSAKPIDTREELAKIANVSHDTINKVEQIEASGNEEVKRKARAGEISINRAHQEAVIRPLKQDKKKPVREAKDRHEDFEQKKQENTVNIVTARQDREDRKVIAGDFKREISKALTGVTNLGIQSKTDQELTDIFMVLDDFDIEYLKTSTGLAIRSLSHLMQFIERR